MKATLTVNGNSVDIELNTEQYEKLFPEKKKKTGYEKVSATSYWHIDSDGVVLGEADYNTYSARCRYEFANYFSDKIVAENMARAQRLWNRIHRRAVELCEPIRPNTPMFVYTISFNTSAPDLFPNIWKVTRNLGEILFDTEEHCQQVIDEFHDELMWYFTEFKDRADM